MSVCFTPLDLESEIEAAVLTAIEAGDGAVPGYYGTRPREHLEPVTHAIREALDYECVMELLLPILRSPQGAELRAAIAKHYAEQVADGVREARGLDIEERRA